jgi:hypothetical protein
VETAGGVKVAAFKVVGTYQSANFHVGDNGGQVQVTFVAVPAATSLGASTLGYSGAIGGSGEQLPAFVETLASWSRAYEPTTPDLRGDDSVRGDGFLRSLGAPMLGSETAFERWMTAEPLSGGSDLRGHLLQPSAKTSGEARRATPSLWVGEGTRIERSFIEALI